MAVRKPVSTPDQVASMQLSVKITAFLFIAFAVVSLWFAIDWFASLPSITDPAEASGAESFAWFWTFLFVVGVGLGLVSWKIAQAQTKDEDA